MVLIPNKNYCVLILVLIKSKEVRFSWIELSPKPHYLQNNEKFTKTVCLA